MTGSLMLRSVATASLWLAFALPASAVRDVGQLDGRERLKLAGTQKKAKRRMPVPLGIDSGGFTVFSEPLVRGALVPSARRSGGWQLGPEGIQQLEAHIADWLRADGTDRPVGSMDEATVVVEDVTIRGKRNKAGTRARLVLRAQVSVQDEAGAAPRTGTYKFKGAGRLAAEQPLPGQIEEGLIPGPSGPVFARYRVVGDEVHIDGDMVLSLDQLRAYRAEAESPFYSAVVTQRRWPGGKVPYVISSEFYRAANAVQLRAIESAIRHWNTNTEIEFVPHRTEESFVMIRTTESGCRATTGRRTPKVPLLASNYVWLAPICSRGAIIHEFGHTVGLFHEQSRTDRDTFITVDFDNILADRADQFDIKGSNVGPYNFRSIMHYSQYSSVAVDTSLPTFTVRRDLPEDAGQIVGQKEELSKGDIAAANYLATGDERIFDNAYSELWHEALGVHTERQKLGDVTGDGAPDLVAFGAGADGGRVYVGRNAGESFDHDGTWLPGFCLGQIDCLVGDVDGDGIADVVEAPSGRVGLSNGSEFRLAAPREIGIGGLHRYFLADVNNDCRSDLVGVYRYNQRIEVYVALSDGEGFAFKSWWGDFDATDYSVGDVDGDGAADLVVSLGDQAYVHPSDGSAFGPGQDWWPSNARIGATENFRMADVDGDGLSDMVRLSPDSYEHAARVMITISDGFEFRADLPNYHEYDCKSQFGCELADVDGDGLVDLVDAVSDLENPTPTHAAGEVYVSRSTSFITNLDFPRKPVSSLTCGQP